MGADYLCDSDCHFYTGRIVYYFPKVFYFWHDQRSGERIGMNYEYESTHDMPYPLGQGVVFDKRGISDQIGQTD